MARVRTVRPPHPLKQGVPPCDLQGKAHSPSGQACQASQGGQGCLEPHLPQGSPKEAKRSGKEGTLSQRPWLAGGAQTILHVDSSPKRPPSIVGGGAGGQRNGLFKLYEA